jgi:hypothetical protein
MSSHLESFANLLAAARAQAEPQRLLFVFAAAELPGDASPAERTRFERGDGGTLAPVLCVDKRPEEIADFAALVRESLQTGVRWDIAFVAAMSGRAGFAPGSDEAVQPLRLMVEAIKGGRIGELLAVDRSGELVQLERA